MRPPPFPAETTIDNDNITLAREFASTAVVLEWARNVLANRLATDARSWAAIFSTHASGTYTNSWMVRAGSVEMRA